MGGIWQLAMPNLEASVPGNLCKGRLEAPLKSINLLKETSPTLMELWAITNIRIPMAVLASLSASGAHLKLMEVQAEMEMILRLGDDIVWAVKDTTQLRGDIKLGEHEGGPEYFVGGLSFAETLTQPIIVSRGRTLTIEGIGEITASTSEGIEPENINVTYSTKGANGTFTYQSENLSGYRTL